MDVGSCRRRSSIAQHVQAAREQGEQHQRRVAPAHERRGAAAPLGAARQGALGEGREDGADLSPMVDDGCLLYTSDAADE